LGGVGSFGCVLRLDRPALVVELRPRVRRRRLLFGFGLLGRADPLTHIRAVGGVDRDGAGSDELRVRLRELDEVAHLDVGDRQRRVAGNLDVRVDDPLEHRLVRLAQVLPDGAQCREPHDALDVASGARAGRAVAELGEAREHGCLDLAAVVLEDRGEVRDAARGRLDLEQVALVAVHAGALLRPGERHVALRAGAKVAEHVLEP
jgi:hypothetical protein